MRKDTKENIEKIYTESELLTMLESVNDNLKIAIERMKACLCLNENKRNLKNGK